MFIEFLDGSAVAHPNFDHYMRESTGEGTVPLRFDCAATAATSAAEIAARAAEELQRRETEEHADILPATLVATRAEEPSGHHRYRVLAIARLRKPDFDRLIVRVEADP